MHFFIRWNGKEDILKNVGEQNSFPFTFTVWTKILYNGHQGETKKSNSYIFGTTLGRVNYKTNLGGQAL